MKRLPLASLYPVSFSLNGRGFGLSGALLACIAGFVFTGSSVLAINSEWQNTGTDWGTASNWSPADVPDTNQDIASITSPTLAPDVGSSNYTVKTLNFGGSTGSFSIDGSGLLTLDADNAASANVVFMGSNNANITLNPSVTISNNKGGGSLLTMNSGSLSFASLLTYNGLVQQTVGTVNLNDRVSLGSSSNYQITGGGTLNLNLASSGSTGNASALFWAQNGNITIQSVGDLGSSGANFRIGAGNANTSGLSLQQDGLVVNNAVAVQGNNAATGTVSIGVDISGNGSAEFGGNVDLNNFGSSNRVIKLTAATDDTATFSGNLTQTISPGAGSEVQFAGGGTVIVSGNGNDYTIASRVTGNTSLIVENTGLTTATGTQALTVDTGSLLGGNGRVSGAVIASDSGSEFSPGTGGVGDLTLAGGFTASSGATFSFDVNGALGDDSLIIDGSFTGGSSDWTFNFFNLEEGSLLAGEDITIISTNSGFSGVTAGDFNSATINYFGGLSGATFSFSGNDLLVSFSSVPEPGHAAVVIGTLGLILAMRRLRKRSVA